MIAKLGTIEFTALTGFTELSNRRAAIWSEQQLVNGKAVLQKTGEKNLEITTKFFFEASFCNPQQQLDSLVGLLTSGLAAPLSFGNGRYIGDFVVSDITDTPSRLFKDGTLWAVSVDVTLKEFWVPNAPEKEAVEAVENAQAIGAEPILLSPAPAVTVSSAFTADLSNANVAAKQANDAVSLADRVQEFSASASEKIDAATKVVTENMNKLQTAITTYEQLESRAGALENSIQGCITAAQALQAAMPITSISEVKNLNSGLQNSIAVVNYDALNINTAIATRRI